MSNLENVNMLVLSGYRNIVDFSALINNYILYLDHTQIRDVSHLGQVLTSDLSPMDEQLAIFDTKSNEVNTKK